MVAEYGRSEVDGEEKDRFWNDVERTLDTVGNGYRLCIQGYLNKWIGERERAGITGTFGVPEENNNDRRVAEFCTERGLWVGNIFKHRSLHKVIARRIRCEKLREHW